MIKTTITLWVFIITLSLSSLVLTAPPTSSRGIESTSPGFETSASRAVSAATSIRESSTKPTTSSSTTTTTTTTTMATSTTGGSEDSATSSGEQIEFQSSQNTSTFTCTGKVTGYYADVKLHCRVYHFCTAMDGLEGPTYSRMSYMCLENSFFDQRDLNCVKKSDLKVPCERAEAEYESSNKQFDEKDESQPSMSDNLAANIMMNPIARFIAGR